MARRSRLPKVKHCAPFVAKVDESKTIRPGLRQNRYKLFSQKRLNNSKICTHYHYTHVEHIFVVATGFLEGYSFILLPP